MQARDAIISEFNRQFLQLSDAARSYGNRDKLQARVGAFAHHVLSNAGPYESKTFLGIKLVKDEGLNANEVSIVEADRA